MSQFKFKDTALAVLSSTAQEIMADRVKAMTRTLTEDEAYRLYAVTKAAMDLGASPNEVSAALKKGFDAK